MITQEEIRTHLDKALDTGIRTLRLYIKKFLSEKEGNQWHILVFDVMPEREQQSFQDKVASIAAPEDAIDYKHLSILFTRRRDLFKEEWGKDVYKFPSWVSEIQEVRNTHAHNNLIEPEDALRAINNLIIIFRHIGLKDKEQEMEKLREELRWKMLSDEFKKRLESDPESKQTPKADYEGPLVPWFRNVMPHMDIQQGHLDESVFAANLGEVAKGDGREVYQNAAVFFEKTFFTQGLRTIAERVIKGLNGKEDAENRVISLQTGFGGGKTHSLISLYHLAKLGRKAEDIVNLSALLKNVGMPEYEKANVAVFTNTTNDPTQGRHADGVHIQTIWGEIAYQLGGKEAYELIRANDESLSAPAGIFKKVLAATKPALILIDELADYCVKASGRIVGGSTLSDQTVSFIQELSEAVASTPNCVLVATLPASEAEVANSPQAAQILQSLSNRLSRVGKDTKPVEDNEIFEVIRYRLFEDLGKAEVADQTVSAYMENYEQLVLNNEVPSDAAKGSYREKLKKSYPFHPELIDMFRVRWASNHDFQRTRGVLRLLASIVSDLWKRQHSLVGNTALIHTSDVNFGNLDALSSQLKKLYGNGYDAVIAADVSGASANSNKIDQEQKEFGAHDLAKGIASTILLGSFGSTGGNRGISVQELKLCVLKPGAFNHNSVNGALDAMENKAHYLYYSSTGAVSKRYWFHTKPNINILINQAKSEDVGIEQIHQNIVDRLNNGLRRVARFKVIVDPSLEIPEQKQPTLLVLHPRHQVKLSGGINGKVKPLIKRIAVKKGEANREYLNTMLFLVCNEIGYTELQRSVKEYLACQKVREDYKSQMDSDQKEDIRRKLEESNRDADKALVTAYSVLTKWHKQDLETLQIKEFASTIEQQIGQIVYDLLIEEEWLLARIGYRLLQRNNLTPKPGAPVQVKKIYESFLRYSDFPMITGSEAIRESLLRYCLDEEVAIASGNPGEFSKHYIGASVQYFDVSADDFWLVAPQDVPKPEPEGRAGGTTGGSEKETGEKDPIEENGASIPVDPVPPQDRRVNTLTVSGKVDVMNYHQIFQSFINPLRENQVEIELKITARSTSNTPITENSPQYKVVKESARQLGLDFGEE